MKALVVIAVALSLALSYTTAYAQSATAPRIRSNSGAWLLPVAGNVLCSDEAKHIGRGSVRAWDLCVPYGSAIYPLADGKVIYAGCNNAGGYGCWVMIQYAGGFQSIMGHMISGSITVASGQTVKQNQVIGRVGWTGMTSFGPHTHLEIHHAGAASGRVMIGDYFNRAMLKDCPLCNVGGEPVQASGAVGSSRNPYSAGAGGIPPLWIFLAGAVIMALILGWFYSPEGWLAFSLWHGGSVAAVLLLFVFRPMVTNATTSNAPLSSGGEAFEIAYKFTAGAEGWKCTEDGAHTFGGVTQGTYSAWRMSHGMGPADVCGNLTEQQRRDIFNERYWVASGANKLPAKLAITYVDHVFNTGGGSAGLAACGNDAKCYNDWRIYDYGTKGNCNLYCRAWVNRVNRVRSITE